jgi:integrase
MPFTLIPPGRRKGNPFYLARGTHPVTGRDIEISTKTRDKTTARRFAQELWIRLAASGPPRPGEAVSFAQAALLYADFRGLDLENPQTHRDRQRDDAKRLNRLIGALGSKMLADINQAALVTAANQLCPDRAPATKNREVMRMAAAVLHYMAECKYCDWLRVKLFKESEAETRAIAMEIAEQVIAAAPEGRRRLILLWFFRQGTRITQTLGVSWDHISLAQQTFRLYDKKAQKWQTFPLHPEVFEQLSMIPETERVGRLWPWTQKTGVYKWLRPLTRQLGIEFTPHMGRHSLGTWLNASGAGAKTIQATLGHKSIKSTMRYVATDIEIVRAAAQKVGEFPGKVPNSRRNAGQ